MAAAYERGFPMNPRGTFQGKICWVAGGAGYLGAPVTAALDAAGATVVCLELPGRAEQLVRERALKNTVPVALDLTDLAALRAALPRLIAAHGAPHGFVHLPFVSSSGKKLEELSDDDLNRTFTGALTPAFELCRAVALAMAETHGGGSIVLFSSMYGLIAPDPGIYSAPMTPNPIDYGASKAAILQMTRYLAVHYGPRGVRFNSIVPGPFPHPTVQRTNPAFIDELKRKTPLRRVGTDHEIVAPTLFLLADGASYVTGHSLVVDGGWTIL